MQRLGWLLFLTCAALGSLPAPRVSAGQPSRSAAPRRRALLVAVSDYHRDERHSLQQLNCRADVERLAKLLHDNFRFEGVGKDVKILYDKEATRDGILNAIDEYLIAGAKPGDVAYFHFSGHGQE